MFPFAINEGMETPSPKESSGTVQKVENQKIRVCIPGIVTQTRRDYHGLFKILDAVLEDIKHDLVFDFLGFVEQSEPELLDKIKALEQRGLEVYYYTEFVFGKKFDGALAQADILLNNQIVQVSHTTKYGFSKESGMLFNMIRGAKPGIFPMAYTVDKTFENALLHYANSIELCDIILGLANKSIDLDTLKIHASDMADNFTPKKLYSRLVKENKIFEQIS